MQNDQPSLLNRSDTLLGVCEGIGQDLGFNPLWLRLALTAMLFLYPLWALGLYAALGATVAASRWLFPAPRHAAPAEAPGEAAAADSTEQPLPLAA